jgi:phospholipid N-methyltransferase
MARMICVHAPALILEPTAGDGNLTRALESLYPQSAIKAPKDFFKMRQSRFDAIVMNPPFTPMSIGYEIMFQCMDMSDNIIALMPWLTIINSERRLQRLRDFGLRSVHHLPRNTFKGSRVQTCILELVKTSGYCQTKMFYPFSKTNNPAL